MHIHFDYDPFEPGYPWIIFGLGVLDLHDPNGALTDNEIMNHLRDLCNITTLDFHIHRCSKGLSDREIQEFMDFNSGMIDA